MRRFFLLVALVIASPALAADKPVALFDGKSLAGWEGDTEKTWKVEDGCIVGGSLEQQVPRNEFLCTTKSYENFELKVTFKLTGDKAKANAGVQFRTKRIPKNHEVSGYQAASVKTMGALYDESRRNRCSRSPKGCRETRQARRLNSTSSAAKVRIRLWLNGKLTVTTPRPTTRSSVRESSACKSTAARRRRSITRTSRSRSFARNDQ